MTTIDEGSRQVFGRKQRANGSTEPPNEDSLREVLRRARAGEAADEAAAAAAAPTETTAEGEITGPGEQHAEPEHQHALAAQSQASIGAERLKAIVTGVTASLRSELRDLRNELDELEAEADERARMIFTAIQEHASWCDSAIAGKKIIAQSVAQMRSEFAKSRTPLPPVRNI